jgi:hypothetical protein
VPVGTALVKGYLNTYRYACAGEDLKPGVPVGPDLSEEDRFTIAFSQTIEGFADIIFGKVMANPKDKRWILGWPIVEVKKGSYFWLREMLIL